MDDSPFGRLSPEIRNRIYEFVFDEGPITSPDEPSLGTYTFQPAVALTQTCRTIRKESRAMFYFGRTISHMIKYEKQAIALRNFLDILGAEIVCKLYSLKVIIWDPERPSLWHTQRKVMRFSTDVNARELRQPDNTKLVSRGVAQWVWTAEQIIIDTLARMKVRVVYTSGWDVDI